MTSSARVVVVACGAGAGPGGRSVYAATVQVVPAAAVRVQFTLGGPGMSAADFTSTMRAAFVAGIARGLGVDILRVLLLQVPGY